MTPSPHLTDTNRRLETKEEVKSLSICKRIVIPRSRGSEGFEDALWTEHGSARASERDVAALGLWALHHLLSPGTGHRGYPAEHTYPGQLIHDSPTLPGSSSLCTTSWLCQRHGKNEEKWAPCPAMTGCSQAQGHLPSTGEALGAAGLGLTPAPWHPRPSHQLTLPSHSDMETFTLETISF